MGISFYLIWKKGLEKNRTAAIVFGIQLSLNVLWSAMFFGLHLLWGAFAVIVLLWASILATILLFRKISKTAAGIMVPYILWVTFAAALNLAVAMLNA
jgi:tryptophan-rich sensory protein